MMSKQEFEKIVASIKDNSCGDTLILYSKKINDIQANEISKVLADNTSLKLLNLISNQIGETGAKALAEALLKNKSLQTLSLKDNQIGDIGTQALADSLVVNNTLFDLDLDGNQISYSGSKALAKALVLNSNLRNLRLNRNQIGTESAEVLADALIKNNTLLSLELRENQISKESTMALADALVENNTLLRLDLQGNQIDHWGAKHLSTALTINRSLLNLELGNQNDDMDVKRVKAEIAMLEREHRFWQVDQFVTIIKESIKKRDEFITQIENTLKIRSEQFVTKRQKEFDEILSQIKEISTIDEKTYKERGKDIVQKQYQVYKYKGQKLLHDIELIKGKTYDEKLENQWNTIIIQCEKTLKSFEKTQEKPPTVIFTIPDNPTPTPKVKKETISISDIIDYNSIKKIKELGRGAYGIVHLASCGHIKEVAFKELVNKELTPDASKEFEVECQIMPYLRSPNIVQFYGYCPKPHYGLVMEYMPLGSLYSALNNVKVKPLDWSIRTRIATNIACGLAYLHQKNILHRDIKSLNVLLNELYQAKLTDFGFSKVKTESSAYSIKGGSYPWMAPEVSVKNEYTKASDIYSMGITFWEISSPGNIPFKNCQFPSLIPLQVSQGVLKEEIPKECPKKLATLIQACWDISAQKRPTADEVATYLNSDKEDFAAFLPTFRNAQLKTQKSGSANNNGSSTLPVNGNEVSNNSYMENLSS